MGLFGGKKDRKDRQAPLDYLSYPYGAPREPSQPNPWQLARMRAEEDRAKFFNNISGQSWNVGKSKMVEALKSRGMRPVLGVRSMGPARPKRKTQAKRRPHVL
jgi:hypothetical protein